MIPQSRFGRLQFWPWLCAWLILVSLVSSHAADLEEAQRQLIAGDYSNCIVQAQQALEARSDEVEWRMVLAQALLANGAGMVVMVLSAVLMLKMALASA